MKTFVATVSAIAVIMAAASAQAGGYEPPPKYTPAPTPTNNAKADAAAFAAAAAYAKSIANGGAGGAGGAGGGGGNATGGNGTGGNVDNRGSGSNSNNYTQAGIPVSSAVAPSFAIGQCQWAVSGGASFFGFGGSAGGAGLYEFCKGMMQADHFRRIGREDMAKLMECNFDNFRAAYRDAGTPCRQDVPKDQLATTPIVQSGTMAQAAPAFIGSPKFPTIGACIRQVGIANAASCQGLPAGN